MKSIKRSLLAVLILAVSGPSLAAKKCSARGGAPDLDVLVKEVRREAPKEVEIKYSPKNPNVGEDMPGGSYIVLVNPTHQVLAAKLGLPKNKLAIETIQQILELTDQGKINFALISSKGVQKFDAATSPKEEDFNRFVARTLKLRQPRPTLVFDLRTKDKLNLLRHELTHIEDLALGLEAQIAAKVEKALEQQLDTYALSEVVHRVQRYIFEHRAYDRTTPKNQRDQDAAELMFLLSDIRTWLKNHPQIEVVMKIITEFVKDDHRWVAIPDADTMYRADRRPAPEVNLDL